MWIKDGSTIINTDGVKFIEVTEIGLNLFYENRVQRIALQDLDMTKYVFDRIYYGLSILESVLDVASVREDYFKLKAKGISLDKDGIVYSVREGRD